VQDVSVSPTIISEEFCGLIARFGAVSVTFLPELTFTLGKRQGAGLQVRSADIG
jgi:hypothetical protein